jgi:threonine synthase
VLRATPGRIVFHSTNGGSPAVNLRAAIPAGWAPDRGLYLPGQFPQLAPGEIAAFTGFALS